MHTEAISKIRLLVFDWDGTLMDSEAQIVACLHASIRDHDLEPMDDHTVKDVIGLGLREAIDTLVPGRGRRFQESFTRSYRKLWFNSSKSYLFAGAREALGSLRRNGYFLAVATGKARNGLNRVLAETELDGCFDSTRCSDETRSKPDPQMLREIMAELDIEPAQTAMIGDTEYDMAMASNAGTHKIAVSYGIHSPDRLNRYQPLACLDTISEILHLFNPANSGGTEVSSINSTQV